MPQNNNKHAQHAAKSRRMPKKGAGYNQGYNRGAGNFTENTDNTDNTENDENYKVPAEIEGMVYGRNAIKELFAAGRTVDKIFILKGEREGSIIVLIAQAKNSGIPVIEVERSRLDTLCGGGNHQGIVAMTAEREYSTIDEILNIAKERGEAPLVVIADKIEDPHNLGALIRSAECSGAHGVIIPKRRSSGLSPVVSKASAGALEHMAVARVVNISAAIEKLKAKGLWIFAVELGGTEYYKTDLTVPSAVVLGSEGGGISRLVKEKCDFVVSIPVYGRVNSLNVSAAAAVVLSFAAQQRKGGEPHTN